MKVKRIVSFCLVVIFAASMYLPYAFARGRSYHNNRQVMDAGGRNLGNFKPIKKNNRVKYIGPPIFITRDDVKNAVDNYLRVFNDFLRGEASIGDLVKASAAIKEMVEEFNKRPGVSIDFRSLEGALQTMNTVLSYFFSGKATIGDVIKVVNRILDIIYGVMPPPGPLH